MSSLSMVSVKQVHNLLHVFKHELVFALCPSSPQCSHTAFQLPSIAPSEREEKHHDFCGGSIY